MRRRFGRGRPREPRERAIDARGALERVTRAGLAPALEPERDEAVPAGLAALGAGVDDAGGRIVVGYSPESGAAATLAALAHAQGRADRDALREVLAVAPRWTPAARGVLGLFGPPPFAFRAVEAPASGQAPSTVEPDRDAPAVHRVRHVARRLADPGERALCERAAVALEGLAAKHGGTVRATGPTLELVVLARRAAVLRAEDGSLVLETLLPRRGADRLSADGLAGALDKLEGGLRKLLNERALRESPEGLRTRLLAPLGAALGLRCSVRWPLPGADPDPVDLLGVDGAGRPVVAAAREELDLDGLVAVLEGVVRLRPWLGELLDAAPPPVRLDALRVALAAERFAAGVERTLGLFRQEIVWVDVQAASSRAPVLVTRAAPEAAPPARAAAGSEPAEARAQVEPVAPRAAERPPRGARRRAGAPREPSVREPGAPARATPRDQQADVSAADERGREERFEELSFFDLEDEGGDARPEGGRGRRRRRGRGRRGRPRSEELEGHGAPPAEAETAPPEAGEGGAAAARAARGRGRRGRARGAPSRAAPPAEEESASGADEEAEPDEVVPLAPDVPEVPEEPEPAYDDEEEVEEDTDEARMRREREARRRARLAKAEPAPAERAAARAPRRRAALVAHADRDSIAAAVLLARDLRLLEGIWVYPQPELMTFFRSVTTDLRDDTPIYVVGFTASPAREIIRTASLYRGRLTWIDHHAWPPEDRDAMCEAIGAEFLHMTPGTGSALPAVLTLCTRRSRFSDKLVDLVTGRFSEHDFGRWGRLWLWRLAEVAGRTGDRRADLEALLAGRPSDLAREAASAPPPPPPAELEFAGAHDFRLVHFGGYALVVAAIPRELDLHLASRILRERYGAQLSVTWQEGASCVVLSGDDSSSRRALDLGAMAEHLAQKHDWIEPLSDADHVARVSVRDLAARPERIDAVVAEIAMGRSILEG